jgi:hypothetical protein
MPEPFKVCFGAWVRDSGHHNAHSKDVPTGNTLEQVCSFYGMNHG